MKRAFVIILILHFIILILHFTNPLGFADIKDTQIRESGKEIFILNLLNSLYLTNEQIEFILGRARELEELRPDEDEEQRQLEILESIKGDLKNDNYVTDINREEFVQIKKEMESRKKIYGEKLKGYAKEVKDILTPVQQKILEDYKPCIIPPKGPSRIGQADDSSRFLEQIEKIRQIPEDIYNNRHGEIAERAISRWMDSPKGYQLDEKEKNDLYKKILEFYKKIRSIEDIDFEVSKENLANEFKNLFPQKEIKMDVLTKISKFLLSNESIKILGEELEKL